MVYTEKESDGIIRLVKMQKYCTFSGVLAFLLTPGLTPAALLVTKLSPSICRSINQRLALNGALGPFSPPTDWGYTPQMTKSPGKIEYKAAKSKRKRARREKKRL